MYKDHSLDQINEFSETLNNDIILKLIFTSKYALSYYYCCDY